MTNSNGSNSSNDLRDLRLPYLEDLLSPEETDRVEKEMHQDPDFAGEVEELRNWTRSVEENKALFCLEPWEAFEHARSSADTPRELSAHVEECESCQKALRSLSRRPVAKKVPLELWERMTGRQAPSIWDRALAFLDVHVSTLLNKFSEAVRIPPIAVGAAVAAVLVALVILPSGGPDTVVGLSNVKWGAGPLDQGAMGGLEAVPEPGGRVSKGLAFVILFEDFKRPLEQDKLDSLYEELKPVREIRQKYRVVTPAEVRKAVIDQKVSSDNVQELMQGLRAELGVANAVLVKIKKLKDGYLIRTELIDTQSGDVIRQQDRREVNESALPVQVGAAGVAVLDAD